MDDDKGKDVASQQTKEYWEKEKARLEASKLGVEVQNYPERLHLEDEKLKSDLKDWYLRIWMTLLTGIATVASFFIGKAFQNLSDEHKQVYELQLQRDRIENEEFNKNIALLSSADAAQRAVAVATLRRDVQHYQDLSQNAAGGQDPNAQRVDQVLGAVSIRLPSETDSILLQEYSQIFMSAPSRALPYIVLLNRQAGPPFARSAAQYIAWNLRNPSRFSPEGCANDAKNPSNAANQRAVSAEMAGLSELITRTEMPSEGETDESGTLLRAWFDAPKLLAVGRLAKFYQRECRRVLEVSSQTKNDQRMNQRIASENELLRAGRFLSFSSLTLNRVLQKLSGHLANQHLDGTFMINGALDNLNLSGAKLGKSYIVASGAQNFTCENCDFSYADLSQFNLMQPIKVNGSIFKGVDPLPYALKDYVSKGK